MDKYISAIAIISSIITVVSFILNIIQYILARQNKSELRTHMQANYNGYYSIARASSRAINNSNDITDYNLIRALEYIEGVSDIQRNVIIAYCREHLSFLPFYEHPMYPGMDQPPEIKAGCRPEQYVNNGN